MAELETKKKLNAAAGGEGVAGANAYEEAVSSTSSGDYDDDDDDYNAVNTLLGDGTKKRREGAEEVADDTLTDNPDYFGAKTPAPRRAGAVSDGSETATATAEDYGRTDDPVRMYLREMGNVELLTREGEIEIAKRIEAGKLQMSDALFTTPYTYALLLSFAEKVTAGEKFLRDIIDLSTAMGIQEDVPEELEDEDDSDSLTSEAKEATSSTRRLKPVPTRLKKMMRLTKKTKACLWQPWKKP